MAESAAVERIVDLILELDLLESMPRMGFLLSGVSHAESVAAHCYGVALTAMLMADAMPQPVDAQRVLRMALLHEVSEARVTDLPYRTMSYIAPAAKSAAERAAARDLLQPVDEAYASLWEEFEVAKTLEARIVRAADKIQMMVKVLHYEREGRGDLTDFWRNVEYNENDWGLELARTLFEDIRRRHEENEKGSRIEC